MNKPFRHHKKKNRKVSFQNKRTKKYHISDGQQRYTFQQSFGVIVFLRNKDQIHNESDVRVLLVQGYGNHWGFPKGGKEEGESHQQAAIRELYEETGVTDIELIDKFCYRETFIIKKKRKRDIQKRVTYFVAFTNNEQIQRQVSEVKNIGWFSVQEVSNRLPRSRAQLFSEAVAHILKR